MKGHNEFVVTGNSADWNRWADLHRITVPMLLSGRRHDSMNPAEIDVMRRRVPNSRVPFCEIGSHPSVWDDTQTCSTALGTLLAEAEARTLGEVVQKRSGFQFLAAGTTIFRPFRRYRNSNAQMDIQARTRRTSV